VICQQPSEGKLMPTIMDGNVPATLLTSEIRGGAEASNRLPVTLSFGIGSVR
jgi:hypothetical protein